MKNTKHWKLPIEIARDERMNTYGMKLAGFETLELHARHLDSCSKISERLPPLEAHHWHTR